MKHFAQFLYPASLFIFIFPSLCLFLLHLLVISFIDLACFNTRFSTCYIQSFHNRRHLIKINFFCIMGGKGLIYAKNCFFSPHLILQPACYIQNSKYMELYEAFQKNSTKTRPSFMSFPPFSALFFLSFFRYLFLFYFFLSSAAKQLSASEGDVRP